MKKILCICSILFTCNIVLASDKALIPYSIIEYSKLLNIKQSIDVRVDLVDGRLPLKEELGEISKHIVSKKPNFEKSFVLFYLPHMEPGAGAYAEAHHNPDMKVEINKVMLYLTPEYKEFYN